MICPFREDGGKLVREFAGETLCIEPWGANSFRVRSTCQSHFITEDWALLPQTGIQCKIAIGEKEASITNGKIKAVVKDLGKITYYNQKGEIILEEYERKRIRIDEFCSALNIPSRDFRPILGADFQLTARFEAAENEKIYGMGQYQQPFLDLKGCTLELAHRNSQASVPFALSSRGYGFLWNNPAIGKAVFGKNMTEWSAKSTKQLDYWITAGDTPAEIEEAYAGVTGTVPMMPEFAMGFWQCKLRYQTQEELLSVAREYKRRGIPLACIVVDFFHWTKHGEWKFDPKYWPDPDGMIRELNEMGTQLMVSIWPTVDKTSENFEEMQQKGYLVRSDKGIDTNMEFEGTSVFFDATNPGAREFIWSKAKKNYYDKGIKAFWLDEAEPEYHTYDYDLYRYYSGTNLQTGNIYPKMYAKAFYDGMKAAGQEEIINLVRCAWAGSQRYGALVWSGDIHSSFRSLREQFGSGLNMGLAGIPWWTTDIGGFLGAYTDDPSFHECIARWFEYGAFCPVFRLHGERLPHLKPLGNTGGGRFFSGSPNEIWSYGEENYEIFKKYILLRESLRPYIRSLMKQAHLNGTPVMHPLFYDFPEDPHAWEITDQYLFGKDVLVAPILYEGMRSRKVYLPQGQEWRNAHTGEIYKGGATVECEAPLDVIPVFLSKEFNLSINI